MGQGLPRSEQAIATIDRYCAAGTQEEYLELIGEPALAATRDWRELA